MTHMSKLADVDYQALSEKAHSILHKVREIVMWGWSENTSCQGPEHAHIDIIKSVAHLTNNKDVFLCILRYHCCRACCSSTNSCWKTWLGRVRLANYNWIEVEWKRPWQVTEISAFLANWVCAILHCGPWWTGTICICVLWWGSTSMDMLIIYYVYVLYILHIFINIITIYC